MDRVIATQNEDRYARQIRLSHIGQNGQERLRSARIAIVGLGALGTAIANHLTRAGVGYLRLIDRDFVEMSNLTRQMLFDEKDATSTTPKVIAAAEKLKQINSEIEFEPHITHMDERNAEALLSDVDLILDGTDNFTTRYLINDVSHKLHIPWIYGAVIQSRGAVAPIIPNETACLRCIIPNPPDVGHVDTCDTVGVLGPVANIVASYQTTEAIKWLVGDQKHLNRHLLHFDVWQNQFMAIDLSAAKRKACPCCALGQYHYLNRKREYTKMKTLCGRKSIQIQPGLPMNRSLEDWENRLREFGSVERTPFLLKLIITERLQIILFADDRVIIQGTDQIDTADKIYHYYLGI